MKVQLKIEKLKVIGLKLLIGFLYIIVIPFYSIGRVLYHFSKLTFALSHLLMLNFASAKDELRDFWSVWTSVGDI